jgi:hypothetical protein
MCCDPKESRHGHGCCEGSVSCCEPRVFFRRFRSTQEEGERLQAYREELEKEIAGVNERIQELKRK